MNRRSLFTSFAAGLASLVVGHHPALAHRPLTLEEQARLRKIAAEASLEESLKDLGREMQAALRAQRDAVERERRRRNPS